MNIFQDIGARFPKKSKFNLTHSRKFSFAPGVLYPTLCQEILPSDRWTYDTNALVRFQPMISPVMHLVDVYSYSFFVPDRLTMRRSYFELFITGGPKGDGKLPSGEFVNIPVATFWNQTAAPGTSFDISTTLFEGSLADFLGISIAEPSGTPSDSIVLNMMPFIAFWKIWNEYFRDQNLHPDYVTLYPGIFDAYGNITAAIYSAVTDPDNPFHFFELPKICWEKDYLTSGLPFAQRGEPVETPLSGTGTVSYKEITNVKKSGVPATSVATHLMSTATDSDPTDGGAAFLSDDGTSNDGFARVENIEEVELTSGGFTINALRLAARLQEWLEKMARGGARYIEQIKSHFGVTSSDARLQRPEYLAGGKIPVSISEVLQTAENGATPLAEMAGHGISAGKITGWTRSFEEHGIVLSFIFLRPRTAYQQGTPRMFTNRFDKLDWAWPSFAHLGEQEIHQSEVWMTTNAANNAKTFAYQQRYAEYKYIPSTVHGSFKTSLNFWHWGRIFSSEPTLSKEFVECDPDERIFNVLQSGDPMYCIINNRITAIRPLPYRGEPSL